MIFVHQLARFEIIDPRSRSISMVGAVLLGLPLAKKANLRASGRDCSGAQKLAKRRWTLHQRGEQLCKEIAVKFSRNWPPDHEYIDCISGAILGVALCKDFDAFHTEVVLMFVHQS